MYKRQVCLLVGANSNTFNTIVIDAIDNACPISGISSVAIAISVINSAYAGPDVEICLGDSVQLNGSGGSVFNWSMINGDPINVGSMDRSGKPQWTRDEIKEGRAHGKTPRPDYGTYKKGSYHDYDVGGDNPPVYISADKKEK